MTNKWRYFSKWRGCWCEFSTPPGEVELAKMRLFRYRLELNGVEGVPSYKRHVTFYEEFYEKNRNILGGE